MDKNFPPSLVVGNRVWSNKGYKDHGPVTGPKINIASGTGGTITETEVPHLGSDSLLYTINWDNGQRSKHYENGLFCIGKFATRTEFEQAIVLVGPVKFTKGPQGGFRQIQFTVEYDGQISEVEIYDRSLWFNCLEALAQKQEAKINIVMLSPKRRLTDNNPFRDYLDL